MKHTPKTFIKTTFFKYLFSNYLLSLSGLITGIMTYKLIEPKEIGVFLFFNTYETYVTFIRMGVINGLGRKLPICLVQTKIKKQMI